MGRMVFKGSPVSGGVGMGEIHILDNTGSETAMDRTDGYDPDCEIGRLENAISRTIADIYDLKNSFRERLKDDENRIFDVYQAVFEDRYFIQEIRDMISSCVCCAEEAVRTCIGRYIDLIGESGNENFKQKIGDLKDIGNNIIRNLSGGSCLIPDKATSKRIIAVRELTPSLAAKLGRYNVLGIIAGEGAGYLSHASIILRGLEIPALNNMDYDGIAEHSRKFAIIDGFKGILLVEPLSSEADEYAKAFIMNSAKKKRDCCEKIEPAVTKDGYRIGIHANIGNLQEYSAAVNKDIDGIGLVRTEILFMNSEKIPDEETQFYIYSRIVKRMEQKPVVIRTMDIGDGKIIGGADSDEDLPLEELRGIARSLAQRKQLMTQIRSIIRATEFGNVSVMFPMVCKAEEIREVKRIIEDARLELQDEGMVNTGKMNTGAVIETRGAVEDIDKILDEVDFISIGTNDLLQQIMGVERRDTGNCIEDYLHPEFLRTIRYCIDKAYMKNKLVSICGEMAADPVASIILVGMGVSRLSMCPLNSPDINGLIRELSFDEAKKLAHAALECKTGDEVKKVIAERLKDIRKP